MEDTFIFSFLIFQGRWESYEFRSLGDEIKYRQCLAHSRTKSMNIDCSYDSPNSRLRMVSAQVGCRAGWGVEHGSGALCFHFGSRLLTIGQEDSLKGACLGFICEWITAQQPDLISQVLSN